MTYKFKVKPFENQLEAFEASKDAEYFALFCEMGMGKSAITINTLAYLMQKGEVNAALIFAPKGVFANWTKKELPFHMPNYEDCTIVQWQPNITKKFEREILPPSGS